MPHTKVLTRFLLKYGWSLITSPNTLRDDEVFLKTVYRIYLKREIDEEGKQYYLQALQRGMKRWKILQSIVKSSEFRQVQNLPVHPLMAQHQARMILIRRCLPPADVIVDLGGAAKDHPEGALLAMGYPHSPRKITIVDLPPSQRLEGGSESSQAFLTDDGIQIRYLYQSMADPLPIEDASVDLVFSGESIEHITEKEANKVCEEAYRIIQPGGYFCLDTPNAVLTTLQSPGGLMHPEHKREYRVEELRSKLEQAGFRIVEGKGVCPMPRSIQNEVFDQAELVENITLSDEPEEGYLFFLKAIKSRGG
jgi:hypothetical protein